MITPVTQNILKDKEFANRLRIFREQYVDKSQNQASKKLGIAQSSLSDMESGKVPINFKLINILVKDFKLNSEWLTTGKGTFLDKEPAKGNLITDINNLNVELNALKKYIKIMEINQNHLIKRLAELEKKIDSK